MDDSAATPRYTGHPFIDVGLATILAFSARKDIASIDNQDLKSIADYMDIRYRKKPMSSLLTLVFPNSGFVNPTSGHDKREQHARLVLRSYCSDNPTIDEECVFFGIPAAARVYREHIPLIGSESTHNFYAEGQPGLPVSGLALLCIQAFPLGCIKCSGRILLLHADRPDLTYVLARRFLQRNLRYLDLTEQAGGTDKYADAKFARTQFIAALLDVEQERRDRDQPTSVTAYHLSNYGTNADVDIFHLPLQITDFLWSATGTRYKAAWTDLEQRGWEQGGQERDALDLPARRNVLYEDLLDLPREAHRFLRTYLLRVPRGLKSKADPRRSYSLAKEVSLVSWELTELFLRKVMGMEKQRIETIKAVGERIADHIFEEGDKRLFNRIYRPPGFNSFERYERLRAALIQSSTTALKHGKPPLINFDEYIAIFEDGEELARVDWQLARDLVLIRVIDRLYQRESGWLSNNIELSEVEPELIDEAGVE